MLLRFQAIGRIGIVGSFALFACTSSSTDDKGTGGSGSPSGGMTSAGTGTGIGGSGTGGAGAGAGGSVTAGMSNGGAVTGGAGAGMGGSVTAGMSGDGGPNGGIGGGGGSSGSGGGKSKTTFFVTSDTSKTGKLGGLDGADKRCQDLAMKAGIGDHTFHAYLSTAAGNAKDRIGTGPWVNSAGVTVAENLAALHSATLTGNPDLFIDENKMKIHGQWDGGPVEHDILTGSKADGTLQTGVTCQDWTSDAANDKGQVGHSDGMGQNKTMDPPANSWNSAHASGSCANTTTAGGAGRLYCFAID
jgi:hypothetical protein